MNKPTILISKTGAVGYSREYSLAHRSKKAASAGEQGTTEAVLRHLGGRGDLRVVYFGQWRGVLPDGIKYVEADVAGLNDLTTAREQKERWANDMAKLRPFNPKLFITIAGYASNTSWIDNPLCNATQACAVRYTGPLLNVIQKLKLPRVLIVNDIRNYPKEAELTWGWEWLRPIACLSQREKDWSRIITGKRWNIREVYSAAEHWRDFHRAEPIPKDLSCVVCGHAHIGDGKRLKTHDAAWRTILGGKLPKDLRIYGQGWEHFSDYDPKLMPGLVSPAEVEKLFARSKTTVVTITGGELYTNKARFALAQNCLPLFYGRGEPHTMDPLGKYLPLDSPFRIGDKDDLMFLVNHFGSCETSRQDLVDKLWKLTEPNWSMLDDCIDKIIAGVNYDTDWWWNKFGGYRE